MQEFPKGGKIHNMTVAEMIVSTISIINVLLKLQILINLIHDITMLTINVIQCRLVILSDMFLIQLIKKLDCF